MTIKDIARESGYAVSTVSRALNNHPDVSRKAKEKIQKIVEECGFVPNNNAKQLKQQQSQNIVIIVKGMFNLFFNNMIEEMQSAVSEAGYGVQLHYIDEDDNEVLAGAQLARERKPRGIVFLGGNSQSFEKSFSDVHLPCVLVTFTSPELHFKNLSLVGIDDQEAGRLAGEYLLNKGHRRIGVIGGNIKMSEISSLRYRGFCGALQSKGLQHPPALYQTTSFNLAGAYRAMQALLASRPEDPPTAVFCMSDIMAVGAIRAARDAGLRVPEDISVLGFDGIELGRYATPRIATVRQPQKEMVRTAIQLLMQQIERRREGQCSVLPIELVEGESVAERLA
ncbi:MAG: LacI family DNA-binding transcriptional regulator [Oscillospiraceae bacterium]|nr:LacI family DNA-binding transcriptional regulator [Oscillospiraceae bacterium]